MRAKSSTSTSRSWDARTIRLHVAAAALLEYIKEEAFSFLRAHPTAFEGELLRFVKGRFKGNELVTDRPLIIAFGPSAAKPHYSPKGKGRRLRRGMMIKVDIWGRLRERGAPFADITWMGFSGRALPAKAHRVFGIVIAARDAALALARRRLREGRLPTGAELDGAARGLIAREGFGKRFIHRTGHCLGFTSPHGIFKGLRSSNTDPIHVSLPYTIEPGIYLPGEFGVRSEIDFYIDAKRELVVTTPMQRSIIMV